MSKIVKAPSDSPSKLIGVRIRELGNWRGEMLGRLRAVELNASNAATRSTRVRQPGTTRHRNDE